MSIVYKLNNIYNIYTHLSIWTVSFFIFNIQAQSVNMALQRTCVCSISVLNRSVFNLWAQSLLRVYNDASTPSTKSFSRVVRPMEQYQPPSTTKVNYYELNKSLLKSNTNILEKATYSHDNRVTGRRTSISTPAEETHIASRNITRVPPK